MDEVEKLVDDIPRQYETDCLQDQGCVFHGLDLILNNIDGFDRVIVRPSKLVKGLTFFIAIIKDGRRTIARDWVYDGSLHIKCYRNRVHIRSELDELNGKIFLYGRDGWVLEA